MGSVPDLKITIQHILVS